MICLTRLKWPGFRRALPPLERVERFLGWRRAYCRRLHGFRAGKHTTSMFMGETSQVKTSGPLRNSTRTPRPVRPWTGRAGHRGRGRGRPYCARPRCRRRGRYAALWSAAGRAVSLPEALSVKTRSRTWPSSWRFSFWSSVLTRTYPIRCPVTVASTRHPVRLSSRPLSEESQGNAVPVRQVWVFAN